MGVCGNIEALVQPIGGMFKGEKRLRTGCDEPKLTVRISHLGDISQVWAQVGHKPSRRFSPVSIDGGGTALTAEQATLPSLAEGLERYCTSVFSAEQFVTASAEELGRAALDLATIPACSSKELAHPRCPLTSPDKKSPIRWVQAVSLLDGKLTYIPAVMVYLHAGYASPGERIWIPITTGCAAHVSYERALLAAILEVIERDALSILWLHELPLPRIEIDQFPEPLAEHWDRYQKASAELEYMFFDATTDLGVPTVYSLQVSRANRRVMTLVSCSTALDPVEAVVKVMRDMASCRLPFRNTRQIPANWDHFTDLFHGAAYMARAEQAGAFNFLVNSADRRPLSSMPRLNLATDKLALREILNRFRRQNWDIYAVDLSTDEALRAGFRAVRAVIPALQPFSFYYRARYLGHPRLYEAARMMGYPAHDEEHLNQWPQPFS
jgi:ribosomal protein S12 methylthiotransferase accessory factor